MSYTANRREFLKAAAGISVYGILPAAVFAQDKMLPVRSIPGTGEELPVIGLGSTKPVMQIPEQGTQPLYEVLGILREYGGSVVDTAPRTEAIDKEFGQVLQDPRWKDQLFVSTKITAAGRDAGIEQLNQTQRLFGRRPADLVQVQSMVDIDNHWPVLRQWKADGGARYIGVTVARTSAHDRIESFMKAEKPDFIQINYSVAEPGAEQRLLPLAADLGIAVQVNRPFMNGSFFEKTKGRELPGWAAEFDCPGWAQFSLKYILGHPAVTCVLTETTSADHMRDNIQAAFGRLPDSAMKTRMRTHIENI